jgi:hypothetical protein
MRSQRHLQEFNGSDSAGDGAETTGVRAPTTLAGAAGSGGTCTVTLTRVDGGPLAGIAVGGNSSDDSLATVPQVRYTDANGDAPFYVSYVAAGTPTITFSVNNGAAIGTCGVTVS